LTFAPTAANTPGEMQLLAAHQILIGAAIALAVLFGARAMVLFHRSASPADLVLGVVALLVAAALGKYLQRVRARWIAARRP